MKVLIVAKTRRGGGACVGGITASGQSVRLIAHNQATNDRAGMEYEVGEVWEIESTPDPDIVPPHVENTIVRQAKRLRRSDQLESAVNRFMPAVEGGPDQLFDGLLQALPSGALYIAERTGLPSRSTHFWRPDQPLKIDCEGKRIRYRYPTADGGRTLTFVGFQEPVEMIPAGTLLRVSLAHWWRPKDKPDEELRCHAQLSGWFLDEPQAARQSHPRKDAATAAPVAQTFPSAVLPTSLSAECPNGERAGGLESLRYGQSASTNQAFTQPATVAASSDLNRARQALKTVFGYTDFQSRQAEVIQRILERKDTLAVMPTGGGKSLCYQLPALLFDGLTAVVSPLIALMQDQVQQLRQLDVPAALMNHLVAYREHVQVAKRVREGKIKILYAAPETLLRPETLRLLEDSHLACLAIDEAHCISEWGHDFRPEYRQLHTVRRRFPQAVCVALTATATPRVREDIKRLLAIDPNGEFVASFNRPNLFLGAMPRSDGLGQTLAFLEAHRDQSGIIYCAKRRQVDELASELAARGWPALPYHAGLEDQERHANQERFTHDDDIIMVATVAFGMGINKSNVRFVLHYNLPKDIESYYQEIGRAGRDGLRADCLLLHSRADAIIIRRFIDEGAPDERPGRQARLEAMLRYAETRDCRRRPLLSYFGESGETHCGHCDNCLTTREPAEQTEVTVAAQKFLSCVVRTGEVFGPAHIIDVLRGSRSQPVLNRGHQQLSTHGIGLEHSKPVWKELARQFIAQGLVVQDPQFGGLRLTPTGREVLAGKKVFAILQQIQPSVVAPDDTPVEFDSVLFQKLRELRRELAVAAGVPPYIIFSDRALREMATQFPRTEMELLGINGVGHAKLARYGKAFLKVIQDYGDAGGLPASQPPSATPAKATPWLTSHKRHQQIGELFAAGQSVAQLQARYRVKVGTILNHLHQCCLEGRRFEANRFLELSQLDPELRRQVLAEFQKNGLDRLGPIHETLGERVSYDELRLLRLYIMCQEPMRP